MHVSYPALRAAKLDPGLKKLLLAELITQALDEGIELILPEGTATRIVSRVHFYKYKDTVSGLNTRNTQRNVMKKLA